MPLARRIAKNILYLFSSNVLGGVISFFLFFYIAKGLGSTEFGKFSFSKAMPQLFIVLVDMGIGMVAIREIARHKDLTSKYLGHGILLKGCLSIITLLVVYISLLVMGKPQDVRYATMVITLFFIATSFISFFDAIFKAHEEMGYPTFFLILDKILLFALIIYLMGIRLLNLRNVVNVYLGIESIILLLVFLIIIRKYGLPQWGVNLKFYKHIFNNSWPFALGSAFFLVLTYCDQVMLSVMKDDKVVGWYSFSYTLINYSGFLPSAFMTALFPVMSRFSVTGHSELTKTYVKSFKYMILFGPPVAFGYYMLAPKIADLAGSQYMPSVLALRIMGWAWLFSCVTIVMINLAYVLNKQRMATLFAAICTIVNIMLNFLLIPRFSLYGSSYATLITSIIYCFLFYIFIAKSFCSHRQFIIIFIKSILAALIMAVAIYNFIDLNIFILVFIGAGIYFAGIFGFRAFDKDDWRLFKKVLSS